MSVLRSAVCLPVIGALALASCLTMRAVGANDVATAASKALARERGSGLPAGESLNVFPSRLRAAGLYTPDDPVIHELQGLLAVRGAEGEVSAGTAASHYVQSLALRPASPNTWVNLAEAKYLVGDTSAIFEHALIAASRLGPSEPQVQRMVGYYGLAVREEISPAAREAVDRMVAAGMRRNPLETLQIAQRRGRLDIACRHLSGVRRADPQLPRVCQSTEARQ